MTHIDEGRLQALLDDELHLEERRRAEQHLGACETCRCELDAMRALSAHFSGAMRLLDAEPPRRQHAIGWPRARPARFGGVRRMLPRAAVLLLFVGAAASATVPGSPVRRWIQEITAPPAPVVSSTSEQEVAPPVAEEIAPDAGVAVEAVEGSVEIVLRDADDLVVRAKMVDGTRAGVYGAGPAADSRFNTGAGRIEVVGPRGGQVLMELPRGAATIRVIINGREVLRKQDGGLDLRLEAAGADPREVEFSVEP